MLLRLVREAARKVVGFGPEEPSFTVWSSSANVISVVAPSSDFSTWCGDAGLRRNLAYANLEG
jgi:hypothetical protein